MKGRSDRGKAQSSFRIEGSGKNRSEKGKGPEEEGDKAKLRCTHCGGTRHTRDGCFKLIGYPEWWQGRKGQQQRVAAGASTIAVGDRETAGGRDSEDPGVAAVACSAKNETINAQGIGLRDPDLSLSPWFSSPYFPLNYKTEPCFQPLAQNQPQDIGKCLISSGRTQKNPKWVLDCGATDTVTYDSTDFVAPSTTRRKFIANANGESAEVQGAGVIDFSPTMKLSHCLYVSSLSYKLLSVSHVTR